MREDESVSIAKAARMIGVHPNTLRAWDKQGLIHATRTPTGHRRFSLEEIERVRQGGYVRDVEKRPHVET